MKTTSSILLAICLLAAACGDDDSPEVSAAPVVAETQAVDADASPTEPATETATADATDEELAISFAECMRDEGIDFPDPTVNADGSVELVGDGAAGSIDLEDPAFDAAIDSCGSIVAGASFLPGADQDEAEQQDNLLAFAECLRDLGYDVDDPNLAEIQAAGPSGLLTAFGDNFDPQDPANADAVQECQAAIQAGGTP